MGRGAPLRLSENDPASVDAAHLTLGGLMARLVRDGLDRYDPERPRRTGGRGSVNGKRSASKPARRETESAQRSAARAKGGAVERRREVEQDDASPAAVRNDMLGPSAPQRHGEAERGGAKSAAARDVGRRTDSAAKRPSAAEHGSTKSAPVQSRRYTAAAAQRGAQDEDAHTEEAERPCGAAAAAQGRQRETEHACGQPRAKRDGGGRAASAAKWQGRADGDRRGAEGSHIETGEGNASREPVRGRHRCMTSAAKRLVYGDRHRAGVPAEHSPALERHLAALNCIGALPGFRSRYIPAAVKREVWRRDQGCCSFVDRHSGRRCGSRYRLEIDHVVPFALGGATDLFNLRLRCSAHHKLRHAQRHARPVSGPN